MSLSNGGDSGTFLMGEGGDVLRVAEAVAYFSHSHLWLPRPQGDELPVTSYSAEEGFQPAWVALAVRVHEDQHIPSGPGGPQHPGPDGPQPLVAPEQFHPLQPGHVFAESRLELSWNRQGCGQWGHRCHASESAMTITSIGISGFPLGAVVSTTAENEIHHDSAVVVPLVWGGSESSPVTIRRQGAIKPGEERIC